MVKTRKSKCTPCLREDIKKLILQKYPEVTSLLENIPDCAADSEFPMEFCGGKKKRSAYQEWTSSCMKAKKLKGFDPEAMKDCAAQWRARKE